MNEPCLPTLSGMDDLQDFAVVAGSFSRVLVSPEAMESFKVFRPEGP